jgi:hypothetical protein
MQSKHAQEEADNYRTTENDKLDIQKTASLSFARTESQKQKIEADYAAKKKKVDDDANAQAQAKVKDMFALQKALSITNAIISTYEGADKALASYPPPIGFVLMAATIAAGLANVAVISNQQMPKFAGGGLPAAIMGMMMRPTGLISGPGTGTSDSIPAWISNKEFILNEHATANHLPELLMWNAEKHSNGGVAGSSSFSSFNNYYPKSDNGDLIREMQGMRTEMKELRNLTQKHLENPVPSRAYLDNDEAKKITRVGIRGMNKGILG